ncbi:MAG: hypothetical protein ACRD3G_02700 [Vicinamibacterales bacterium]
MSYAPGNTACINWTNARQAAQQGNRNGNERLQQFDAFLNGFATAYNAFGPLRDGLDPTLPFMNVLEGISAAQLHVYLDRHCGERPTIPFAEAVRAVVREAAGTR